MTIYNIAILLLNIILNFYLASLKREVRKRLFYINIFYLFY